MKKKFGLILMVLLVCTIMVFTFASCGEKDNKGDDKPASKPALESVSFTFDGINKVDLACSNATSYKITVNDNPAINQASPSIMLNDTATTITENYKIVVEASAEGYLPCISEFNISILPKVTGFEIKDGFLHWNAIENVSSFKVKFDGVEQPIVNDTKVELVAGESIAVTVEPYIATTNEHYYLGAESEEQNCSILATPTGVKFDNATRTLTWNSVDRAEGYVVKIVRDGKEIEKRNTARNLTEFTYDYTVPGRYEVSVQAAGILNSLENKPSKYSVPKIITRLSDPKTITCDDGVNNSTVINFSGVSGASKYKVIVDGSEQFTTKTSFKHVFEKSANQIQRNIEVYAIGDGNLVLDSLGSVKTTVTQLAIPKNVSISEGTITWDTVANCNGYLFVFDGNEQSIDHNQIPVSALNISVGVHRFSIRAKGNGKNIVGSWPTEIKTVSKLAAPSHLICQNYILSWEAVKDCTNYVIEQGGVSVENVSNNSYQIKTADIKANTNIKVIAKGNGKDILDSNYSESYLLYKLSTPVNVKTNNSNVTWENIKNASSYRVMFNNIEKIVELATSYSWSEFGAGNYRVKVQAMGDGVKYIDSEPSAIMVINKLAAPVASESEAEFTWEHILGTSRYEVAIAGELKYINKTEKTYKHKFTEAGKYNFKVRAEGDAITSVTSNWSNEIIHSVSALPALELNDFTVDKTPDGFKVTITKDIPHATKYIIATGGAENEVSTFDKTFNIVNNEAGKLSVRCKAVGDGFKYVDSNYTEAKVFSVLPAPTNIIWVDEQQDDLFTIKWDVVEGASSYNIVVEKYDISGKKVGENFNITLVETQLPINTTGVHRIKVTLIANGNGDNTFTSDSTTVNLNK